MLELLLKLIDRLIDLTKYRAERQAKIFAEIFDPVFEDLERVHANYLAMFDEVLRSLPDVGPTPTDEQRAQLRANAERLRQQRIEFEPVRAKLGAMTRQVLGGRYGGRRKELSPEADAFLEAVVDYFPTGYVVSKSASSLATSLYAALRASAEPIGDADVAVHGALLPALVRETLDDCRDRWRVVCERHATLQIAVTTAG